MKPVMYIILNAGAGMSAGKLAAQAAHASVEAYLISEDNNTRRVWRKGGHYTKIVLRANDADDLKTKERYLNDRGFKTALIIDEGRTEVDPFTPTAIGVEIVDKDDAHVSATFSTFELFKHEEDDRRERLRELLRRVPRGPLPPIPPHPDTDPPVIPWNDNPPPFRPIWRQSPSAPPPRVTYAGGTPR